LRKYGNFDWDHQNPKNMPKTTEQRLMELEQKVRLLEKQKKQLEHLMLHVDTKSNAQTI